MEGKAWWLECEMVGHTVHTVRKMRVYRKWGWAIKLEGPLLLVEL